MQKFGKLSVKQKIILAIAFSQMVYSFFLKVEHQVHPWSIHMTDLFGSKKHYQASKELLGDNYNEIKKKIKEFQTILKETKLNDIVSITASANLGNYYIEQTYFSILSEIKYFDIEDYYDNEEDEIEEREEIKPPSKVELKKLQEHLKQNLIDDPMFLTCTNKSLRQAFLRDKIDELELHETTAYYLLRESQHIVELAFVQAKNK